MISKETFCKALQMIQAQEETDRKFSDALDLVGDGHFVFGVKNQYYSALFMVLKEAVNDQYDYIEWYKSSDNTPHRVALTIKAHAKRACFPVSIMVALARNRT